MVKGINATDFKDKFNNFESDFECNDVHEIKNRDNSILQICKIELSTKEERDRLIELYTIRSYNIQN